MHNILSYPWHTFLLRDWHRCREAFIQARQLCSSHSQFLCCLDFTPDSVLTLQTQTACWRRDKLFKRYRDKLSERYKDTLLERYKDNYMVMTPLVSDFKSISWSQIYLVTEKKDFKSISRSQIHLITEKKHCWRDTKTTQWWWLHSLSWSQIHLVILNPSQDVQSIFWQRRHMLTVIKGGCNLTTTTKSFSPCCH